jgi:hypothetical protein
LDLPMAGLLPTRQIQNMSRYKGLKNPKKVEQEVTIDVFPFHSGYHLPVHETPKNNTIPNRGWILASTVCPYGWLMPPTCPPAGPCHMGACCDTAGADSIGSGW